MLTMALGSHHDDSPVFCHQLFPSLLELFVSVPVLFLQHVKLLLQSPVLLLVKYSQISQQHVMTSEALIHQGWKEK